MKKLVFPIIAVALLASSSAFAQSKEFGNPGVLVFSAATGGNIGYTSTSPPGGGSSTSVIDIRLQPAMHYFVMEGLSVGGVILFDWAKPNQGDAATTFGIGPTVGYNLWLTPGQLSLWPQANFTFQNTSETTSVTVGTTTTSQSITLQTMNVGVFVPLEIHPVHHFEIGVGPYFNVDISSKANVGSNSADASKNLNLGIMAEISGWTWLGD